MLLFTIMLPFAYIHRHDPIYSGSYCSHDSCYLIPQHSKWGKKYIYFSFLYQLQSLTIHPAGKAQRSHFPIEHEQLRVCSSQCQGTRSPVHDPVSNYPCNLAAQSFHCWLQVLLTLKLFLKICWTGINVFLLPKILDNMQRVDYDQLHTCIHRCHNVLYCYLTTFIDLLK